MRRSAIVSGFIGLLLLIAWMALRQRGPLEVTPNGLQPNDTVPAAALSVVTDSDVVADRGDIAGQPTRIALRDESQTFRNSTLLFAIRRAGFYCADVVSAHESAEDVWVASCTDMLGYVVALRGGDRFDVHPVAQYFDSLTPVPVDRDRSLEPMPRDPGPSEQLLRK
jgi:hypothetical protein